MTASELGYSSEEAATLLHMSPYTLREKIRDHKIGARKYQGRWWFTQEAIDTYLRNNVQVVNPKQEEGTQ